MRLTSAVVTVVALAAVGWPAVATAEPQPSPPPTPPKTVIDADGSYAVGTDIEPGTYRSAGPVEKSVCYWKRVKDGKIVDNALTKKPALVQIEPTDTVFKTDHCQAWQKTACPPDCVTAQPPPPGLPGLPGNLKDFLPPVPPAPPAGG